MCREIEAGRHRERAVLTRPNAIQDQPVSPAMGVGLPAAVGLERITISRNRSAVPADRVNPLYINKIEQIHILPRNREAIPRKDDLL